MLEARALTKRFGDREVVDRVDLTVAAGEVHGLLGRNGAGKTTLLRMLLGLLTPDSGTVWIDGTEAAAGDVGARSTMAGFVEEPRLYPYLSARRNLELLARMDGERATTSPADALDLVGLTGRADDKAGTLSTGMRQRLGVASALLRTPRVLILDEPSIGLDPASAQVLRQLLRELARRGVAILLSSHNMAEVAEICDTVSLIHEGRTAWCGTRQELQAAAPAPAYSIETSDDVRAAAIAGERGIRVASAGPSDPETLTIAGSHHERDGFVLALARAGVAVRRLEPATPPLESLFAALTSSASSRAGA